MNVETGRHRSVIYVQRLCILCDKHEIEDEIHFVLSCSLYNQMQHVFLPNVDMEVASIDTFYNLFNRSAQEVLRLAKYIYNAFIIRENRLNEINT